MKASTLARIAVAVENMKTDYNITSITDGAFGICINLERWDSGHMIIATVNDLTELEQVLAEREQPTN